MEKDIQWNPKSERITLRRLKQIARGCHDIRNCYLTRIEDRLDKKTLKILWGNAVQLDQSVQCQREFKDKIWRFVDCLQQLIEIRQKNQAKKKRKQQQQLKEQSPFIVLLQPFKMLFEEKEPPLQKVKQQELQQEFKIVVNSQEQDSEVSQGDDQLTQLLHQKKKEKVTMIFQGILYNKVSF